LPAGASLNLFDGSAKAQVLDLGDLAADLADDVVMVDLWLAGDVGVVTVGQVDALKDSELGEEVKGTEDGGTTDAQVASTGVLDEVVGREMPLTCGDEVGHRTARLGQAIAGAVHGVHERL